MNASDLPTRVSAVRTTGIFCRPGCPARPNPENVRHFATCVEALLAGFRACKRCHPLGRPEPGAEPLRRGYNEAFQQFAGRHGWREGGEPVHVARIETPLGPMIGAATAEHLVLLEFADRRMLRTQFKRLARALDCNFVPDESPVLDRAKEQLSEFFAGRRRTFAIPLRPTGTDFQARVWDELRRIPTGATRSYSEVATSIGQATAVRAVAQANGDNRIAILIPCHRVIGADGSLTGYGGGLWRKRRLLELESGATAAAGGR